MKFFWAMAILFSLNAQAAPQRIEMIFLSPQKISQLLEILDKKNSNLSLLAANQDSCIPMGEGCFHPQFGFIEKKTGDLAKPVATENEKKAEVKTFNAAETNMVNCDKENYFDIYCGKTKTDAKPADVEIWFDISSSLRTVDYSKDNEHCDRRTFMKKIMEGCKENVRVSVFNTSIKELGDHGSVCLSHGTNDQTKLIQWLKNSQAKTLLIVTDVDEVSGAMRDFLNERGAKTIGDGVKPFSSTDLINYANDFIKNCR